MKLRQRTQNTHQEQNAPQDAAGDEDRERFDPGSQESEISSQGSPVSDVSETEEVPAESSKSKATIKKASKAKPAKPPKKRGRPPKVQVPDPEPQQPTLHDQHGQFQERLQFEPYPFEPATSVFDVPAGSKNPRRLVKAWGHSVSKGPVWELLEDRAWFKEAHQNDIEEIGPFPRVLRPCVYQGLAWENMWEAMEFDPQRTSTWIPQSVPCAFGHFGEQTEINLAPLHSVNICEFHHAILTKRLKALIDDFIPDTLAVVFNTGAPVGSVDWCPLSPDFQACKFSNETRIAPLTPLSANSFKQFLAVAILPSADYQIPVGLKAQRPHAGQLQIWSLEKSNITGLPVIACDMVLELDCGPALDLKWCPLPSHGQVNPTVMLF